jgi:hypothetical protein
MAVDIFRNGTTKLPEKDKQVVRVDMEQDDLQGRKDHLPNSYKSDVMTVQHVPSKGK